MVKYPRNTAPYILPNILKCFHHSVNATIIGATFSYVVIASEGNCSPLDADLQTPIFGLGWTMSFWIEINKQGGGYNKNPLTCISSKHISRGDIYSGLDNIVIQLYTFSVRIHHSGIMKSLEKSITITSN